MPDEKAKIDAGYGRQQRPALMENGMAESNTFQRPRFARIWNYGGSLFLVVTGLRIAQSPAPHLQTAPVSLFLFAVMCSAWLGGFGPGLLAIALSSPAFNSYFPGRQHSFVRMDDQMPRLVFFAVAELFDGSLCAERIGAPGFTKTIGGWT
jgi:K+-sensing histidine kinase KdpD